ncbi:MAG: hypothetical protein QY330_05095 [Candidatus Dojkabacteria bacterium]|uniref:Uncharacterized protein n=1 Tax=Candidatus Dojkabacteria bacterium TaxID=2099670 RepID=A0A952AGR2_9BACT|nr:hypothetical protein [Candidatus Dojkabacteria bacterium]WKZ27890.1 MAG: hypothetical protein QY330_05095 [Candidatus Dojkabacteria bacterium]
MGLFTQSTVSTQAHLPIEDVRDDLVVLKNGNVSLVLETTALNFELLSEREQDAKILSFAGLLNSLGFQMQIVIMTERTDMSIYIDRLRAYRESQISNSLRKQIDIYMRFINNLTINTEVLDKRFFVIIPEIVAEVQRTSMIKQLFGKPVKITNIRSILDRAKARVYPKRDHLIKQFQKMGISARQLNNEELIRLYYSIYDPDKAGVSKLELNPSEITTGMVGALKTEIEDKQLSEVKK